MGVLAWVFSGLAVASLVYFVVLSLQLNQKKPAELKWRGIIKIVSLQGVPAGLAKLYPLWFRAFWLFFLVTCLAVATAVWASDHSFLVVIFPLLFYYFFARYFLWEKDDLAD